MIKLNKWQSSRDIVCQMTLDPRIPSSKQRILASKTDIERFMLQSIETILLKIRCLSLNNDIQLVVVVER